MMEHTGVKEDCDERLPTDQKYRYNSCSRIKKNS